jgi:hypothetical protein
VPQRIVHFGRAFAGEAQHDGPQTNRGSEHILAARLLDGRIWPAASIAHTDA